MDRLHLRGAVLNCWRIPRCGQRILKVTPLNWMRPERTSSGRRLRLAPAFSRFSAGELCSNSPQSDWRPVRILEGYGGEASLGPRRSTYPRKMCRIPRKLAEHPQDQNLAKLQNAVNRIDRYDGIDSQNDGRTISRSAGIALEDRRI